jgi:hypothetical protein
VKIYISLNISTCLKAALLHLYPDDGHNDARNMLIYLKKYIFSPLLHPLVFI